MDAPRELTYRLVDPIEAPRRSGMSAVSDLHQLYREESGNPDGVPVVYLRGGPGEGAPPSKRSFRDPEYYRIVLFDQRGALRSTIDNAVSGVSSSDQRGIRRGCPAHRSVCRYIERLKQVRLDSE